MNKIWVLQNAQPENLGIAGQVFQGCGLEPAYIHTFADEEVPRYMDEATGLVVLGGPMGVYEHDRYPFIDAATRLIDQALKEDKPVLGICLGSQLLAATLGARVARGPEKEIGWHPIELKAAASEDPLMGGVGTILYGLSLARRHFRSAQRELLRISLFCSHYLPSIFSWPGGVWRPLPSWKLPRKLSPIWCETFADEVREEGLEGEQIKADATQHLPALHANGRTFFQNWATLCLEAGS